METNKIGRFVCGVLATYGLVVACGNMKENNTTEIKLKDNSSNKFTSEKLELEKNKFNEKIGKKGKKEKNNKNCPCL